MLFLFVLGAMHHNIVSSGAKTATENPPESLPYIPPLDMQQRRGSDGALTRENSQTFRRGGSERQRRPSNRTNVLKPCKEYCIYSKERRGALLFWGGFQMRRLIGGGAL